MQGLGAIENDIYMNGDKIMEILFVDHKEMSLDTIQRIPEILDEPVLVLKSRNVGRGKSANTRLVIFGAVKADNGKPILAVLDLRPVEGHLVIDDMQKITSAYTKTTTPTEFIRNSEILYADKKRSPSMLKTIGFHAPIELQQSGSIGSISYRRQFVNIQGEPFSSVVRESEKENLSVKEHSAEKVKGKFSLAQTQKVFPRTKGRSFRGYSSKSALSRAGYAMFTDDFVQAY
ncbi:MAG: hypothetical protein IJT76_00545, partial [Clostridia bacterium]|nr:hypothetical protein [Clostridia bacterium]